MLPGNGRRRLSAFLQRSHWSRRDHSVAGWREHATLLAHYRAIHGSAANDSRESRLCFSRPGGSFVRSFVAFSHGSVVSDEARAPGVEIGRPADTYRRVRIESKFGKLTALVTDGHLPYPYGRETTGYEVTNLRRRSLKRKPAARMCSWLLTRPTNERPLSCSSREDTSRKSTPSQRNR